jgi:predicted exporter
MRSSAGSVWRVSLPWLVLISIAALILAYRLQFSFDLSLFFPRSNDLAQRILLKQMESGPGSRFILIGIEGDDRAGLANVSDRLKDSLSSKQAFLQVQNGLPPDEGAPIPRVISDHRFILADLDFSEASLREALEGRMQDLAFGSGSQFLGLVAEDPFLTMLDILEQLTPVENLGDQWFSANGQAVLLAETRSAATDIAAQTQAVEMIKSELAFLDPAGTLRLELTGVGAFGVELQRTIRAEATWRSIIATLMLLLLLVVTYRKTHVVLLAGIPLAVGMLFGLAVVAMTFKEVHGITLAFGFTLLGVAIDYPLHLFSHARVEPPASAIERIWPTMRIGAISTLLAYMAIMLAGSKGLAQLGLFTVAGLAGAVAVTRYWLPHLFARERAHHAVNLGAQQRAQLIIFPAAIVLLGSLALAIVVSSGDIWEDSLSSLSPLPENRLLQDNQLRLALGAPDMRYQLVLHDNDLESLLRKNESLESQLAAARSSGALEGWQSVSALLPSHELQGIRRGRIPEEEELRPKISHFTSTHLTHSSLRPKKRGKRNR